MTRTLLLSLALLSLPSSPLHAEEPARYSLKEPRLVGSGIHVKTLIDGALLPFDRTYHQLTKDQQTRLKSQYEGMSEADEPPFPAAGLADIFRVVYAAQQKRMASGSLDVLVDIDANGDATSASVYRTPDAELGTFVANVLLRQKFKPGTCDGRPCPMVYPFRVVFDVR